MQSALTFSHFTRNIGCNIRGGSARVERALIDGGKRKLRVHNLLQVRGVVVGDANGTSSPGIEDGQHGLPRTESALRFVVPGVECNKKAVREERAATEDPKLEGLLDEIETRAEVELAKLEMGRAA